MAGACCTCYAFECFVGTECQLSRLLLLAPAAAGAAQIAESHAALAWGAIVLASTAGGLAVTMQYRVHITRIAFACQGARMCTHLHPQACNIHRETYTQGSVTVGQHTAGAVRLKYAGQVAETAASPANVLHSKFSHSISPRPHPKLRLEMFQLLPRPPQAAAVAAAATRRCLAAA